MAKTIVMLLGVVFVIVGILGFFNDPVLGIFEVDPVHNIVHLLSGIVALAMGRSEAGAKTFAKVFGLVYLLVTVLGFIMGTDSKLLGLMEINGADNILHLLLAVVLLWAGFAGGSSNTARPMNTMGGPNM